MEKVYAVEIGAWDEIRAVCVWAKKEDAEAFIQQMQERRRNRTDGEFYDSAWDDAAVRELPFFRSAGTLHPWRCDMNRYGEILDVSHQPDEMAFAPEARLMPNATFRAFGATKEEAITNCSYFWQSFVTAHPEVADAQLPADVVHLLASEPR